MGGSLHWITKDFIIFKNPHQAVRDVFMLKFWELECL